MAAGAVWASAAQAKNPRPNAGADNPFAAALAHEGRRRFAEWLAGVALYRQSPVVPECALPSAIWRRGMASLRRYGDGEGLPVLVVPSLINRAGILDLAPGKSFMRWLAARGHDPFLLDWGELAADSAERRFTLSDYVLERLIPAVDAVRRQTGQSPVVLGYCMGGTLCVALAALAPERLRGLVLMAAPWDFHSGEESETRARARLFLDWLEPGLSAGRPVSSDLIQALFTCLQPMEVLKKFRRFGARRHEISRDGASRKDFIRLEDWLNDGVPLAAGAARECLAEWYLDNLPGRGLWRVGGRAVDPAKIALPSLVVVPSRDRIVPPASAAALAQLLPGSTLRRFEGLGHVGMIASRMAASGVWACVHDWLKGLQTASRGLKTPGGKSTLRTQTKKGRKARSLKS